MCKMKRLLFTGALLMALITSCQSLLMPAPSLTEGASRSTTETTTIPVPNANTIPNTTAPPTTAAPSDPVQVSPTVVVGATATPTVTVINPPSSTPETTSTATSSAPQLTVVVASLRLRAGPGTEYAVLGAANQGEHYLIRGQAYACQWYQVAQPQFGEVWVAGDAQYVASATSCDQIPDAVIPAPPTPTPVLPTPTLTPPAIPTLAEVSAAANPADQGCWILQNFLGAALTFTVTRTDSSWNETLDVGPNAQMIYCLAPGHYQVTIDAPPPWLAQNIEQEIKAGDRVVFSILAQ